MVPAVTTATVPETRRIGLPTERTSVRERGSYRARPGRGAAETSSQASGERRVEHVVPSGELAADLRDLRRRLALREHDLGKTDPAHPVEVEREIGGGHCREIIPGREGSRRQGEAREER
jgi:hypothetical protein